MTPFKSIQNETSGAIPDRLRFQFENVREGEMYYWWVNIELDGKRIGKARIEKRYGSITIHTINVFSEYERLGIASFFVEKLQESAREIIAENVRPSARPFWSHVGFSNWHDGNYRWSKELPGLADL